MAQPLLCGQSGSFPSRLGASGPLAEGVAHSCGLPVLGKQGAWHKDPFLWCPRPGKELVGFPTAWVPALGLLLWAVEKDISVLEAPLPQASTRRWPSP